MKYWVESEFFRSITLTVHVSGNDFRGQSEYHHTLRPNSLFKCFSPRCECESRLTALKGERTRADPPKESTWLWKEHAYTLCLWLVRTCVLYDPNLQGKIGARPAGPDLGLIISPKNRRSRRSSGTSRSPMTSSFCGNGQLGAIETEPWA